MNECFALAMSTNTTSVADQKVVEANAPPSSPLCAAEPPSEKNVAPLDCRDVSGEVTRGSEEKWAHHVFKNRCTPSVPAAKKAFAEVQNAANANRPEAGVAAMTSAATNVTAAKAIAMQSPNSATDVRGIGALVAEKSSTDGSAGCDEAVPGGASVGANSQRCLCRTQSAGIVSRPEPRHHQALAKSSTVDVISFRRAPSLQRRASPSKTCVITFDGTSYTIGKFV